MAEAQTIEIPITSEGVMALKQSCQVIILAYQKYCGSIIANDENAIFPTILPTVLGVTTDCEAGDNAVKAYENSSLDGIKRPAKASGDLTSYSEISQTTGNYPISQKTYDEVNNSTSKIFKSLSHREVQTEDPGSTFKEVSGTPFDSNTEKKNLDSIAVIKSEETVLPTSQSQPRAVNNILGQDEVLLPDGFTGAAGQSPNNAWSNPTKGKFKNSLLAECIPCSLRLVGPQDIEIGLQFKNLWKEFQERIKKLIQQIKDLLNNNGVLDDLCNLLNFLDFQCVPDLAGLVALLMALIQKYSDLSISLDGMFNAFIGNFFSPILGGLSEILDRYIQMIIGPVDCIIGALDKQLVKLDVQNSLRQADIKDIGYHNRREGTLRRKIEQLEDRKSDLEDMIRKGSDANKTPPINIGGTPRSSQSNPLRDVIDPALGNDPNSYREPAINVQLPFGQSIQSEINHIDNELNGINGLKKKYAKDYGKDGTYNIAKLNKEANKPDPTVINGVRQNLAEGRKALSSSLYELKNKALLGRNMINDTLKAIQGELQRILFGRAATAEEQMAAALELQKIARLIGIINVLINLKTIARLAINGKLCNNDKQDPSLALGSFLQAMKGNGTEQTHSFYKATGYNGDGFGTGNAPRDTLIIAPSDAVLELTDPETEQITLLDNLDEIAKLNNNGSLFDLGNIADKKITARTNLGEAPVSIVEFDLCTNKDFSTKPDLDKIKNWANNAGLNI